MEIIALTMTCGKSALWQNFADFERHRFNSFGIFRSTPLMFLNEISPHASHSQTLFLCALTAITGSVSGQITSLGKLTFEGPLDEEEDLSAVAILGDSLLVGSDEGTKVQILQPDPTNPSIYRVRPDLDINMLVSKTELDIEGIARFKDTNVFYVAGSHSLKRTLLEPNATKEQNLAALEQIVFEPSRFHIYRLEMDLRTLKPISKRRIGLYRLLSLNPVLKRFTQIPSKENGVDIEAIAVKGDEGDKLHLGFRGPVLRENLVPIMILDFNKPEDYKLRYLDLGGLRNPRIGQSEGWLPNHCRTFWWRTGRILNLLLGR